jgi:hypothetical protein
MHVPKGELHGLFSRPPGASADEALDLIDRSGEKRMDHSYNI